MLDEFLTWWKGQLVSLLPPRLRGRDADRDTVNLVLAPTLDTVEVPAQPRFRTVSPERFGSAGPGFAALRARLGARTAPKADLVLPPGLLLEQAVTLPLATERELGRVLRFEMDRLTPFAADDVFWSWRITGRNRGEGQLHLVLSLTPRAPLLPVLDALAAAGLRARLLRSGAAVITLDQVVEAAWRRRVRWGLAAACAVLAVGAAAAPFLRQSLDSRKVERGIAALRPAVERADALRRRAVADAAGVDVLAAQRAESGNVLAMLAALTVALPDDTSLTDLAFRARVATISGRSGAAVRLIPLLTAEPALQNTAFTAAVTRNDTTGTEGFTLQTELVR